jgi:hypothetical protein
LFSNLVFLARREIEAAIKAQTYRRSHEVAFDPEVLLTRMEDLKQLPGAAEELSPRLAAFLASLPLGLKTFLKLKSERPEELSGRYTPRNVWQMNYRLKLRWKKFLERDEGKGS